MLRTSPRDDALAVALTFGSADWYRELHPAEFVPCGSAPLRSFSTYAATPWSLTPGAGCGIVLITLGSEGLVWADAKGSHYRPAQAVTALDSTGAGDTFIGALAAARAQGQDLNSAIDFAQRAAAFSVQRRGAQASMPTRRDLAAPTAASGEA